MRNDIWFLEHDEAYRYTVVGVIKQVHPEVDIFDVGCIGGYILIVQTDLLLQLKYQ